MATHSNLFARQGRELLWIFLLLALLVILPTIGMFVLLSKTVENERFAVRQRLVVIHKAQLTEAKEKLTQYLEQPSYPTIQSPPNSRRYFAEWLDASHADTLALLDSEGFVRFPRTPRSTTVTANWTEGEALEFQQRSFQEAINSYRQIFIQSNEPSVKAQALQRIIRCLVKGESTPPAIETVYRELEALGPTQDRLGHSLLPYTQLYLLQQRKTITFELALELESNLLLQLEENLTLTAEQRSFILLRLAELGISCSIPHLEKEKSASKHSFHEFDGPVTSINEGWMLTPPNQRVRLYYSNQALLAHLESILQKEDQTGNITIRLALPQGAFSTEPFLEQLAAPPLSDWRIGLFFEDGDPFQAAEKQATKTYLWFAILAVACILIIAIFLLKRLVGHLRLTQLKNDFLATVSHELKTPLTSSRLLLDTLLDGHLEDQELTERYLKSISKENERLIGLVENFLTLSRAQRGETPFQHERLNAQNPVKQAYESIQERFTQKDLKLTYEFPEQNLWINGDENALTTALINLLDNALKYSLAGAGPVTLRSYREGQHIAYEVTDQGIGISKSNLKKVTEQFFQANRALSRVTEGCGLGLGIVKLIAEAHGGNLSIESELDQGSTFTLTIPLCDAP